MSKTGPTAQWRIALTLSIDSQTRLRGLTRGARAVAKRHPDVLMDDFYPLTQQYDGSYLRWREKRHYDGQLSGVDWSSIERIRRRRLPLVLVEGAALQLERPWVGPDYASIARQAVNHLLQRGYRELVYFHSTDAFHPENVIMGEKAGKAIGAAANLISFEHGSRCRRAARFRADDQIADLADLLRKLPHPVGVFACNDIHAWRALMACDQAGLRVPQQVGILGVGDDPFLCESTRPALSSVGIHYQRIGETAMELLLHWLRSGQEPPLRTFLDAGYLEIRESTAVVRPGESIVSRAVSYMNAHLHEKIDMDRVARSVGTSRRSLIRCFKADLGRNPGEILRELRVETAVHHLKATELPISAIAAECGFTDQSHMTRVLKSVMDVTPLELRRR